MCKLNSPSNFTNYKYILFINTTVIFIMVKRTSTIQATLKDAQSIVRKRKTPRSTTIDQTLASAKTLMKPRKKSRKTRTMV